MQSLALPFSLGVQPDDYFRTDSAPQSEAKYHYHNISEKTF